MSVGVVIAILFILFLVVTYVVHRIVRKTIWLFLCAVVFLVGGIKVVHLAKAATHSTQHALRSLTK